MAKPYFRTDTLNWYVLHKRNKIKVGKSERAAKHLAEKINLEEAEGRVGIHGNRDKDIELFFNEIQDYKKNIRTLKNKSIIRYQAIINNFLTFLKLQMPSVVNLSQLNQTIFEQYIRYRKTTPINRNGSPVKPEQMKNKKDTNIRKCVSDKTIKNEIVTLKSFLEYAVKNKDPYKRYLAENPLQYLEPLRVNTSSRKRALTKEEVNKFLDYLQIHDSELYEIFFILIYTGMRDGELRHLQWDDIDLEKRFITLREKTITYPDGTTETWTPKTRKGKREIPMHDKLYEILVNRNNKYGQTGSFVFPDKDGGILRLKLREQMIHVMRKLGINDFTRVHDLRRTFISFMAMAGVPRETTMDIVGHVDEETYELYRESSQQHKRESVNRLDFGR